MGSGAPGSAVSACGAFRGCEQVLEELLLTAECC